MMVLALADGSHVPAVDVKCAQVHPHFWSRDQYYVQVELRDGCTKDVVERVSLNSARERQTEISHLMEEAWVELDPYDYGRRMGAAEGWAKGYSAGLTEGQSEGRRSGWASGYEECRRSILSHIFELREAYTRELARGHELSPNRRRFLRKAVALLTDIIERFSVEPA